MKVSFINGWKYWRDGEWVKGSGFVYREADLLKVKLIQDDGEWFLYLSLLNFTICIAWGLKERRKNED